MKLRSVVDTSPVRKCGEGNRKWPEHQARQQRPPEQCEVAVSSGSVARMQALRKRAWHSCVATMQGESQGGQLGLEMGP